MEDSKFIKICELLKDMSDKTKAIDFAKESFEKTLDASYSAINLLIEELYGKDGRELFDWFMYEKGFVYGKDQDEDSLKAFDEDGAEIIKTIKDLHAFLELHYVVV